MPSELLVELREPRVGLLERPFVLALFEFQFGDRVVVVFVGLPFVLEFILPALENARAEVDFFLQFAQVFAKAVALRGALR